MLELPCPACGAGVPFRSRVAVFAVCSFCESMVVRRDLDLETLGKMAALPPDMSPLQLGTRGRHGGRAFELVGRLKIGWEDGHWNEWYALFEDGSEGWLAEAQGFFSLSFPVADPLLPPRTEVVAGNSVIIGRETFVVDDVKDATCIGSEGELPFTGAKGRRSISVDLSAPEGRFGCIEYARDGTRLYLGRYVEFEQLALSALREIDGW